MKSVRFNSKLGAVLTDSRSLSFLLLAAATGAPGITRLVAIFLAEKEVAAEILGDVLNDLAIANALCFLTCIGFSSLLVPRIAKIDNPEEKYGTLNGIILSSMPLWLACVGVVYALSVSGFVFSFNFVLAFIVGFSVYQFVRHYFVANGYYVFLVLLELFVFVATLIGYYLVVLGEAAVSLLFSFPFLIVAVVYVMGVFYSFLRGRKVYISQKGAFLHGLRFGLTNMLSGGVFMMLVPVVRYFSGPAYAALMGTAMAVSNILMLITRPLSNYYLPAIAKSLGDGKKIDLIFRRMLALILGASFAFLLLLVFGFDILSGKFAEVFSVHGSFYIVFLFVLSVAFGQLFLPHNCWLVAGERSGASLKINFAFFIGFVLAVLLVGQMDLGDFNKILSVLVFVCLLQILKGVAVLFVVKVFRRDFEEARAF